MRQQTTACLAVGIALVLPGAALADDEASEFWLNPSVTKALNERASVEFETAQRLRKDPRVDTYFTRLWLNRDDSEDRTWSLGVEQRWNGPDQEEQRILQQVKYAWGPIDFRTRMEQRFVSTDDHMGWRLRHRMGSSIPLGEGDSAWSLTGDAEVFYTLKATREGGQAGLTGLRTFVGFEREIGRYEVSLGYLRQQDIRDNREDRIGHAPFIGLNVTF